MQLGHASHRLSVLTVNVKSDTAVVLPLHHFIVFQSRTFDKLGLK